MSWLISKALMDFVNLPCSRAMVEEYSEENFSDGEQCAPLSVMPTPHKFWHKDKMMDASNLSRFGLTCAVLTEDRGAGLLMSYLEGFRAKTSAKQEKEQGSQESEAGCGKKWRESLAKYDRNTSSWKTHQCSLLGDWESYSETFPNWGMMLDGELYRLQMSEHLIKEKEYGLLQKWQTPTVQDANGRDRHNQKDGTTILSLLGQARMFPTQDANMVKRVTQEEWTPKRKSGHVAQYTLNQAVMDMEKKLKDCTVGNAIDIVYAKEMERFQTPTCSDVYTSNLKSTQQKTDSMHSVTLPQYVMRKWGTPKVQDSRHAMMDRGKGNLGEQVAGIHGGKLNPDWVEWLMGVPLGWSDLQPLGTLKYLSALQPPFQSFQQWEESNT